jgi:DNA polymerase (family 10)
MAGPTGREVAAFLEEYRVLLELSGADSFRVRAFANAARAFENLQEDLEDLLARDGLTELRGVGRGVAELVEQFARTGTARAYEELREKVPAGLLDMLRVPGLGPKKIIAIRKELGIDTLEDLEQACLQDRLSKLSGFGKKTQENILKGIEHLHQYQGRFRLDVARQSALPLLETLRAHPATLRVELAGSLRRWRETVKDIDLVLSTDDPEAVSRAFAGHASVAQVIAQGPTKTSVRLKSGLAADLRVVGDHQFPYVLHHFTGSAEHNVRLRARAQDRGLKINEYGLFRGNELLACADEEEFFRALGLACIPPELREDLGEIEAAEKGELPRLVEEKDIRGLLHVHTTYSDGSDSLEAMALAVKERGYQYLGIADHSQSAAYARGLKADQVRRQHEEIDCLNERLKGFRLFKGIESDILADGSLDYDDRLLESFDFVVASVHSRFNLDRQQMTRRLVRAIEHPATTLVGHPTGRLLLEREGYALDIDAVLAAAAEHRVAIEINAHPSRLDLDWRHLKKAREMGVLLAVNTDAHSIAGLDHLSYGIGMARKGWLRAGDVINTLTTRQIAAYFRERK